jgi:hypothetical protein
MHRRIEGTEAVCKETQKHAECQVLSVRQLAETQAERQRELDQGWHDRHGELWQEVQIQANKSLEQAVCQEEESKVVSMRLGRCLEESAASKEETVAEMRDAIHAELHTVRESSRLWHARNEKEVGAKLAKFASSLRHMEQATAWVLRKVDEGEEFALTDFRALVTQQEDSKIRWQEIQEKVTEVHVAHLTLESRQAKLENRHCTLEDSQASHKQVAAHDVETLASELYGARGEWARQLETMQLSLNSVLEQLDTRRRQSEQEEQGSQAHVAAVEVLAEAAVASAAAAEDRASLVSKDCELSQQALETAFEAHNAKLREQLQHCITGQQSQDSSCKDLQLKLGRMESESMVALEQLRQNVAERLTNVRSQVWDDAGAVEARLSAWGAAQEDLASRQISLSSQMETLEKQWLAEHRHLAAELDASEARFLCDQRAVLSQVHDFAKVQDSRLQKQATKSSARYEEAQHGLQSMRQEIMESTRKLVGDVSTEQANLFAKLTEELQQSELHAIGRGESAMQGVARELRDEITAAQDLWQELAATQDTSLQQLVAVQEENIQQRATAQEGTMQQLIHAQNSSLKQLAEDLDSSIQQLKVHQADSTAASARVSEDVAAIRVQLSDASVASTEEAQVFKEAQAHLVQELHHHENRGREEMVLEFAGWQDVHRVAAERHGSLVHELESFEYRERQEMALELSVCQEACASALHCMAMDCAALERRAQSRHEATYLPHERLLLQSIACFVGNSWRKSQL